VSTPEFYVIKNWTQFQHYKDRNPAWIKLHVALLASEDWVMLADASKLLAVVCMLVASRDNGRVKNNPAYLKRVAYLDRTPDLKPLVECGFLTIPLADASALQADASGLIAPSSDLQAGSSGLQADARPEDIETRDIGSKKEPVQEDINTGLEVRDRGVGEQLRILAGGRP
jgi:hypothetical protein